MMWLLVLVWAFLVEPAHARGIRGAVRAMRAVSATARTAQGYGRGSDGIEVLTVGALRVCLARQHDIEAFDARSAEREAALAKSEAAVKQRVAALEARAATVDRTDAAAVARFNASVSAAEAAAASHNAAIDLWQQEVAAINVTGESFNRDCAGKRYYVEDYAAATRAGL